MRDLPGVGSRSCPLVLQLDRGSRHSPGVSNRWLLLCSWLCACGGSTPPPVVTPAARTPAVPPLPSLPSRPKNVLYRDEVESAKRAGLGHFFELVDLEPMGATDGNGRMVSFEGFQVVALRPAREWLAFDFAPGDLLTHVNGVSVEHYSTWYDQFEALSKLDQIRVDLIRDGKQKAVVVRIVDRSRGATSQKPSLAPTQSPSKQSAPSAPTKTN